VRSSSRTRERASPFAHRLLGTVLHQFGGERHYALEGSVFVAGSFIKWLRDALGFIETSEETEALARSVEDTGGVVVVPALSGLGAPHWRPEARGLIAGLSFATGKAHIVRAALGAMAHQTHDLAAAFAADGAPWSVLKVDGGMAANDWMAQDIADVTGLDVRPPGLRRDHRARRRDACGDRGRIHPSLEAAAAAMIGPGRRSRPQWKPPCARRRIADWNAALAKV
jgi:glycerol kinase